MVYRFLRRGLRLNSFTLVELLVVMAIIAILAALTLLAAEGVMNYASRSRTRSEIQAMSTALESYKADNGAYPITNTFSSTNAYATTDGSVSGGLYQVSSQILYEALSGRTNFLDIPSLNTKSYLNFKRSQVGNASTTPGTGYSAASSTYAQDPFGYSYGYYTGDVPSPTVPPTPQTAPPVNGTGFYDLWSTGGKIDTAQNFTNSWISNWQP